MKFRENLLPIPNLVLPGTLTSGSLIFSCLLGIGLSVFTIGSVYWIRRYFNLNQFYPQHIKLFSKTELETNDGKRNGFHHNNGKSREEKKGAILSEMVSFLRNYHFLKRIKCVIIFYAALS